MTTARQLLDTAVTEKEFQLAVRHYAKLKGWKMHVVWDSRKSPEGWPDLFMARAGRIVAAELKTEKGATTFEQRDWLMAFSRTGAEIFLWRPSSWHQVEATLR